MSVICGVWAGSRRDPSNVSWRQRGRPLVRSLWLLALTGLASMASAQPAHLQGPDLGIAGIGEVQIQLRANNGSGNYSWSLVSGALPPGVALRTDVPSWFPPDATAGLIGVATTAGPYTFTLRASSAGQNTDVEYTLTISPLRAQDSYNVPDAFVGAPYSFGLTAVRVGAVGPVVATWTATGGLPAGMSLSSAGLLQGTPTAAGFYNVNYMLTEGADTTYGGFGLSVFDVQITTPAVLPNATIGVPYNASVAASGGSGGHTFTACGGASGGQVCVPSTSALPSGLVLDGLSGVVSGIPTGGAGVRGFAITATDSAHVSFSKSMSIDIVGVPPTLPSLNPYSSFTDDCTIGVECVRPVAVNSGGVAPFTWTATGLPPGMRIRSNTAGVAPWITPGHGEVQGVPTETGTFNVEVTVSDSSSPPLSAANTFPMRVSTLLLRDNLPNGTIFVPYSSTFRVLGGSQGYSVTQVEGRLPQGLSLDEPGLMVSGMPTESGAFDSSFRFMDMAGETLRVHQYMSIGGGTRTILVTTNGDLGTITAGPFYSTQFNACCAPSIAWSLESGSLPPGISLSSGGLLSGTPTVSGAYTFMARAADATNPANFGNRLFTLIVSPLALTSPITLPFGNVGSPYNQQFTASGGTGSLTWTLLRDQYLPPGLALSTSGALTGTPTRSGQYSFRLTVTDTANHPFTRTLFLYIYPAGVNPPLDLPTMGVFVRPVGVASIELPLATGGTPPYSYSLAPLANVIPGMRVQNGSPLPTSFSAATIAGFIGVMTTGGSYATTIRVTDSVGATIDRPLTLTVVPHHILTQFNLPKATRNVPYSFTFTPYGGSGGYSWSATGLPAGISIDASGQISGTPTNAGTFSPSIRLTDLSTGLGISIGHDFVVNAFAIVTGDVLPQGTAGTAYSSTLSAPGCGSPCTWTLASGSLPTGVSLSSAGILSATSSGLTGTANTSFTIQASGSGVTVQKVFALRVLSNSVQPLSIISNSPSDITVGARASSSLSSQGGTLPHVWSILSGALPPGITLGGPGETLSSTFGPGFTYLAGKAMQVGLYNFTLGVTDATGATASKAFTWRISALNSQYGSLPLVAGTLVYGTPYTQPLLLLGGTGNYSWAGTLPAGLALNPVTGVVTGVPGNTGSISSSVQVTDTAGNTGTFFVTFNIAGSTPQVINFGQSANFGVVSQGFLRTASLLPSGGTGPYTITALTALPPGFAIQTGNAILSNGTPGSTYFLAGTPLAVGNFTFTLQAQDSVGNIGVRTFAMSVAPFTLFTSTLLPDASAGVPYAQGLVTWDNSGPATWSVPPGATMPPGLTVSSAGLISGTPTQAGSYSFVLNVTDASGLVQGNTFSLKISALAITDISTVLPSAVSLVPYTYTFTATGAGAKVWSATGLPTGLTLSSTTGTISGTVGTANSDGILGNVLVTVSVGSSSVSRRFVLPTRLPNPSQLTFALASTALADVVVGQSVSYIPVPSGGAPPAQWALAPGSSLPAGLNLLDSSLFPQSFPSGLTLLAGAPALPGDYAFDLIATDSMSQQIRRTFHLRVSVINILSTSPRNATAGVAYAQQFTPVGGSPPYTFTMSPVSLFQDMLPPGFSLSSSGLISGTTTSTGNYSFKLNVEDATGNRFTRSYSLLVNNASGLRITSANSNDWWVGGARRSQTLFTSGSSSYTWSVVAGALPPGAALVAGTTFGTTVLAGQPSAPGTYTYTLRATDNLNANSWAEHAFSLRVSPMQVVSLPAEYISAADLPPGQKGVAYSTTYKVAGGTPPYSFVPSPFLPLPSGMTLSPQGVLSGTPQEVGSFTVSTIISDSAGYTFNAPNSFLVITAAGTPPPLVPGFSSSLPDAMRGVAYGLPLLPGNSFSLIRGGVAPYTWTVPAGSSLPPGMAILPGGNGVADHLSGVPTTVGSYAFSLTVADGSGQTLTLPVSLKIAALVLSPDSVSPGNVGSPYSVSFTPSGGTPPYSVQVSPTGDLPPGLTLNGSGVLSGTPTYPGMFLTQMLVTDAARNSLTRFYRVPIDNAAGQAPGLSLSPKPIQVYYVQTSPDPGPLTVAVATTSGALPVGLVLSGIAGASASAGSVITPANVSLNLNLASRAVGTYTGILAASAPASANVFDFVPVTVTVVPPPPCAYSVNPGEGSVPAAGGSGNFSIATSSLCSWTATTADSWVTITSATSGTGPASMGYSVTPNTDVGQRTGTIRVSGQVFTITQFGSACSYAISPASLPAAAAGGMASVSVTASGASCPWTATGLSATPASGVGSGAVDVAIPANTLASSRTLTATIAGQTLTVTQTGIDCAVSLGANGSDWASDGGTGSVAVNTQAGCSYDTVLGPNWITVTAGGSGSGSGTLVFTVEPSSTTLPRSAALTIGGQTFQISQQGLPCSVTVDTSALGSPYGPSGGSGVIGIIANGSNCAWTASSGASWASISPKSGTGNGFIGVSASSNASSTALRTVDLTIAGQSVSLSQAGTTCTYALQSTTASVPAAGGAGAVGVVAAGVCSWTAASNDAAWLTISSSGTGGVGQVQFVAQRNLDATPRTGTLTIAGLAYTVSQSGAPCSYALDTPGVNVAAPGVSSAQFGFATNATGCAPAAVSYASWISVGTSFGGGAGLVTYSVSPNPSTTARSGTIQLGDQTFILSQTGGQCGFSLNAYGAVFGAGGGASEILGSPSALGCNPDFGRDLPFLALGAIQGPVSNIFTLPYSVSPFSSLTISTRRARVTFGGQIFTVKQTSW